MAIGHCLRRRGRRDARVQPALGGVGVDERPQPLLVESRQHDAARSQSRRRLHHGVVGDQIAVGGLRGVDGVVVIVNAAEVVGHVVGVGTLVEVVDPPVYSIEEEMHPAAVGTILSHCEVEVAGPLVASVKGVQSLVPVAVHPAEVVLRPQLQQIETLNR